MERGLQFKAEPHNFVFSQPNQGCNHFDIAIPGACLDQPVKSLVIGWSTVGIAGTVLLDRSNIDLSGAQHLCPTDSGGKKMGVAEWNISHRNGGADLTCCRR